MSRRRRKRESGDASGGWLTTFSDLMSLLLTFFILLFSMSSVDSGKFAHASSSLQLALSGKGNNTSIFEGQAEDMPILSVGQQAIYDQVNEYITKQGLEEKVSVSADERGIYVDINEAILFESGSAEIKDSGIKVLKQLESLIKGFDNDIVIEGHTDNVPSGTQYPTNWELSTARAVSVVRYLTEVQGVNADRICATGYGEYRPIAPNDSVKNRAINRRVNIFIAFEEESED